MKLRFWDRVLATLYVLLSLALCVFVGLRSLGIDVVGGFYERLTLATSYWYFIYFGFLIIIVLLGVYVLRLFFARRPRRSNFVTVDSGDNGKVIIAMDALEQMVRQAATRDEGIADMKIDVAGHEDSISVLVELAVQGGVHLPTVTMNLQRDIRRYVEVNCGVAVRDVTVKVGSVLAPEGQQTAAQERRGRETTWKKRRNEAEKPAPIPAIAPEEEPASVSEPDIEEEASAPAPEAEPAETTPDSAYVSAEAEPREKKWGHFWDKPWKDEAPAEEAASAQGVDSAQETASVEAEVSVQESEPAEEISAPEESVAEPSASEDIPEDGTEEDEEDHD